LTDSLEQEVGANDHSGRRLTWVDGRVGSSDPGATSWLAPS
jgi:hypothetical protein